MIHTHTPAGMAVSALECGLLPLTQNAMFFGGVGMHDYEGPAVDLDEQQRLVRDLGNHVAMILRNHGLLAVGATISEAFITMYWLERACQAQVAAMACNAKLVVPAQRGHQNDERTVQARPAPQDRRRSSGRRCCAWSTASYPGFRD